MNKLTKQQTSKAFRKSIITGALSEEVGDCFYFLLQHRTRWPNGPLITSVCSSATAPRKECREKTQAEDIFYTRKYFSDEYAA